MQRLSNLDDILFPVEEHPLFAWVKKDTGTVSVPVPHKKAIVNSNTYQVLGIVSDDYRLVSNREALDWAKQCCRTVFPETKDVEWEVKMIDAPMTRGHCYIDMMHNSTALDFNFVSPNERPDVFGPFIRVTNSYNSMRALSFDIGFYRKVCTNGMILPESVITFRFVHSKKEIHEKINFVVDQRRLIELKRIFNEFMCVLRDCRVPRPSFETFVFGVLQIHKPKNMKPNSRLECDWKQLKQDQRVLCDRYCNELGENAYAVFNAITEFATHPPQYRCIYRDRHSFQRLAGAWLNQFSMECRKKDFSLCDYLANLVKQNGNGDDTADDNGNERFPLFNQN